MIDPTTLANRFIYNRPIYRVDVDGVDITGTLQGRLGDLTHTDNRGFEADQVDISLDDTDGRLDLPSRGAILQLWIGWQHSGLRYKGSFKVDEIEHSGAPDILTVRARSADLRTGLTTQRERSWHDVTLGALVSTLAHENSLDAAIEPALAAQSIAHLDQTNESAVNLLSRLAGQFDAFATIKDGRLIFMRTAGGRTVSGKPLAGVTIERADGDRHRFSIADRQSYSGVRATYYDVRQAKKGDVIWGDAQDSIERNVQPKAVAAPVTGQYKALARTFASRDAAHRAARKEWLRLNRNKAERAAYVGVKARYNDRNLSVSGEVAYGQADEDQRRKSAQRLADRDKTRLGELPEDPPGTALERSADNIKTLRHVYANKANALRAARAEWRQIQRGMATFSITLAQGNPDLFPDVPATVSGWKRAIDDTDWIITRVVNTLNDSGYTTTLDLEIKATEVGD